MSSTAELKVIEVVEYNTDWPKLFETEALLIKHALGNNCLAVHHVGSTSIQGIIAKPIIDIMGPLLVYFLAIFRCKAPYFGFVINCA